MSAEEVKPTTLSSLPEVCVVGCLLYLDAANLVSARVSNKLVMRKAGDDAVMAVVEHIKREYFPSPFVRVPEMSTTSDALQFLSRLTKCHTDEVMIMGGFYWKDKQRITNEVLRVVIDYSDRLLCSACNKSKPAFRCSKCRKAHYCSSTCQTGHWKKHKKCCKLALKEEEEEEEDKKKDADDEAHLAPFSIRFEQGTPLMNKTVDACVYHRGEVFTANSNPTATSLTFERLDTLTQTVTQLIERSPEDLFKSTMVVYRGKIHLIGGHGEGIDTEYYQSNSVHILNEHASQAALGSWTCMTARLNMHRRCAAAIELDGRLYICGGFGALNKVEVYDPASNEWKIEGDMVAHRCDFSLFVFQGEVIDVRACREGRRRAHCAHHTHSLAVSSPSLTHIHTIHTHTHANAYEDLCRRWRCWRWLSRRGHV